MRGQLTFATTRVKREKHICWVVDTGSGSSLPLLRTGLNWGCCVALHSPIGNFLAGKKKADAFIFNEKEYKILTIK